LAKQLHDEQKERRREVTALWARLHEVDQQVQVWKTQSQYGPIQPAAPLALHTDFRNEVSRLEKRLEERVQSLTDQISERPVRSEGSSETMHPKKIAFAERALETGLKEVDLIHAQMVKEFASIGELQTGLKDLTTKHEELAKELASTVILQTGQLAKDLSSVKGLLKELEWTMNISAIRISKMALQSTSLSFDERQKALASLEKKEHECLNTKGTSAGFLLDYTYQI
jgi:hypothetical protein